MIISFLQNRPKRKPLRVSGFRRTSYIPIHRPITRLRPSQPTPHHLSVNAILRYLVKPPRPPPPRLHQVYANNRILVIKLVAHHLVHSSIRRLRFLCTFARPPASPARAFPSPSWLSSPPLPPAAAPLSTRVPLSAWRPPAVGWVTNLSCCMFFWDGACYECRRANLPTYNFVTCSRNSQWCTTESSSAKLDECD